MMRVLTPRCTVHAQCVSVRAAVQSPVESIHHSEQGRYTPSLHPWRMDFGRLDRPPTATCPRDCGTLCKHTSIERG